MIMIMITIIITVLLRYYYDYYEDDQFLFHLVPIVLCPVSNNGTPLVLLQSFSRYS